MAQLMLCATRHGPLVVHEFMQGITLFDQARRVAKARSGAIAIETAPS